MKRCSILLLTIIMLFALLPQTVYAKDADVPIDGPYEVVFTAEELAENPGKKIDEVLRLAKKFSLQELRVEIPSGEFYLESCLHVFSNTTLILQPDTVFIRDFDSGNMLKLGLQEEINTGYDGYSNIKISGGVWNSDYQGTSCAMRFAHCNQVTLENVTIMNIKNAHHMELAGARDFTIKNCAFSGYKRTNSNDGDAIQIDVLHNSTHFPSYLEFDDTPCSNISVTDCRFTDVYSGVGTGSGVIGSYFDNINIANNYFENVTYRAISAFNYINSNISDNVIKNATVGIKFEFYPSISIDRLFMPNDKNASIHLIQNANSAITRNSIEVKRISTAYKSCGIGIYGGTISKETAKSKKLYAGNYVIQNLNVSSNGIALYSAACEGIYAKYLQNSTVAENTIWAEVKSDADYCGVSLKNCKNLLLTRNKIMGKVKNKAFYNGVSVGSSSTAITLENNKIYDAQKYAITVDKSSKAVINYGNTLKRSGKAKISINTKEFSDFKKTVVPKITSKKKKATLKWKKVKGVTGYRIYRSTKKNGNYELIKSVSGAKNISYTDKDVKNGKTYYYKIAVYKSNNKTKINGYINEPVKIKIKK